ncbi:helix-turn-helix domain-containing protein [Granulicella sp. L56]|uniref:helix-turn-helix domain-containing protein n=1 Tax=Acidobacteriaceae TaxID=204434 RepID=UPI00352E5C1D
MRGETDLTFQAWRNQVRTFVAIPMLTEEKPLAVIADALGYDTVWAFTAMFKRVTGKVRVNMRPPSRCVVFMDGQRRHAASTAFHQRYCKNR